ncbi:MAG: hypothetical protein LBE76_06000 [Nitrososphaerota archaeon]|jgi:transposase|nr:hypothetical protein [Nitrososphaerota archaeon]
MRFKNSLNDIDHLVVWLKQNRCQKNNDKINQHPPDTPIHVLEAVKIEVILANAHQVKHIPEQKTNQSDSERLAQLLCANLISI